MKLEAKEEREAWKAAPMPRLLRQIVGGFHLECRADMARLETVTELAALEAGPGHPVLPEMRDLVGHFCAAMRTHLATEERSLFPILAAHPEGIPEDRREAFASLRTLVEEDHEAEAGRLRAIRSLVETLDAEGDQGRIREAMRILGEHMQKHLYFESQILFPRTR